MTHPVGIHCASELVRLGLPLDYAIQSLMEELDISASEAAEAMRVAAEEPEGVALSSN